MQNWFVVVMGLVTVFVVLILIIGLCWLLGLACRGSSKKEEMQAAAAAAHDERRRSSEGSARPHPRHGLRACLPALVIKCKKAASNDFPKSFETASFDIFGIFAYSVSSSASADTPPVSARHLAVNAVTCSGHLPM